MIDRVKTKYQVTKSLDLAKSEHNKTQVIEFQFLLNVLARAAVKNDEFIIKEFVWTNSEALLCYKEV